MLTRFQFYLMAITQTVFVITLAILPIILYYLNILTTSLSIFIVGNILMFIALMVGLPQYNYEAYLEQQKKIAAIKDKHKADKDSRIKD